MSKHINMYKTYGVMVIAAAVISFIYLLVFAFSLMNRPEIQLLFGIESISSLISFLVVAVIILGLILLFIGFLEFSSSFTFAEIVKYEESSAVNPFVKPGYALPARMYSVVATVISVFNLLVPLGLFVASLFFAQVSAWIPMTAFFGMVLINLYTYMVIYNRYKYFSDLLEYETTSKKPENVSSCLQLNNTDCLKGYGIFTIVFLCVIAIATLVLSIFAFPLLKEAASVMGITLLIVTLVESAIIVFSACALGCFSFDIHRIVTKHTPEK